jgi:hypothetical protein
MAAIPTTQTLLATGLAMCCALGSTCNALADDSDTADSVAQDIAQLVQWHSGASAASGSCTGAREAAVLYAERQHISPAFLAMHGAPAVAATELDDAGASTALFEQNFLRKSVQSTSSRR